MSPHLRMIAALLCGAIFLAPVGAQQPGSGGPRPGAPTDQERRLANLEKQLEVLRQQIDELRKDLKAKPAVGKSDLRIFALKHVAAEDVVKALHAVFGETNKPIRIVTDQQTNSVLVSAPEQEAEAIQALLTQLDVPVDKKKSADNSAIKPEIKVFSLKNLDPSQTVKVLREIFPTDQYKTLRLSVSEQTNSIVAAGSVPDLMAIEALLVRLEGAVKEKKTEKVPHER